MPKTDKAAKRKAKLRARKRQMNADRIGQATRLSSALERLCAPILPEYIDDSNGLDLIGRRIVYQMGMIAWNIAVTGRRELADTAFANSNLDEEQQTMVRNEILALVKKKYAEFPGYHTAIRAISVFMNNGKSCLKVQSGDTFPALPTPVLEESFPPPANPIRALYDRLFAIYGEQHWWPCKSGSRWEIVTGAILTQNCAWTNVEKALVNLENSGIVSPEAILKTPDDTLRELIRPAGFFKQKSVYLKSVAQFFLENEQEFLQSDDVQALRKRLLAVKGVGNETADSILLYAFQKPLFVIDVYTRRVAERHLNLDGTMPYGQLQKIFMDALPIDVSLYGEYHALIVALCKQSCLKSGCGDVCSTIKIDHADKQSSMEE